MRTKLSEMRDISKEIAKASANIVPHSDDSKTRLRLVNETVNTADELIRAVASLVGRTASVTTVELATRSMQLAPPAPVMLPTSVEPFAIYPKRTVVENDRDHALEVLFRIPYETLRLLQPGCIRLAFFVDVCQSNVAAVTEAFYALPRLLANEKNVTFEIDFFPLADPNPGTIDADSRRYYFSSIDGLEQSNSLTRHIRTIVDDMRKAYDRVASFGGAFHEIARGVRSHTVILHQLDKWYTEDLQRDALHRGAHPARSEHVVIITDGTSFGPPSQYKSEDRKRHLANLHKELGVKIHINEHRGRSIDLLFIGDKPDYDTAGCLSYGFRPIMSFAPTAKDALYALTDVVTRIKLSAHWHQIVVSFPSDASKTQYRIALGRPCEGAMVGLSVPIRSANGATGTRCVARFRLLGVDRVDHPSSMDLMIDFQPPSVIDADNCTSLINHAALYADWRKFKQHITDDILQALVCEGFEAAVRCIMTAGMMIAARFHNVPYTLSFVDETTRRLEQWARMHSGPLSKRLANIVVTSCA